MSFEQRVRQQQAAADEEEKRKRDLIETEEIRQVATSEQLRQEVLASPQWHLMRSTIYNPELWEALEEFWKIGVKPTKVIQVPQKGFKRFLDGPVVGKRVERPFKECVSIEEDPLSNAYGNFGKIVLKLQYDEKYKYTEDDGYAYSWSAIEIEVGYFLKTEEIVVRRGLRRGTGLTAYRESDVKETIYPGLMIKWGEWVFMSVNGLLNHLAFVFRRKYPNVLEGKLSNSEIDTTEEHKLTSEEIARILDYVNYD